MPEPNDLLVFARVVEAGSLSRAAELLELPVSTVSRRITMLESQIGERLLFRTTRKLSVSDLGRTVLKHARHVVEGVEAAAAVADNRQRKPGGRLRVSVLGNLGLIGPFLAGFASGYPSIVLELEWSAKVENLDAQDFDVALHLGQLPGDSLLVARRIVDLRGGLYASPTYLNRRGTPREPQELLKHDALQGVSRPNESIEWILQRGEMRWQGVPSGRIVANSPELLVGMAIHGGGVVMTQHRAVEHHVENGRLVRLLPDWELPVAPLWALFPSRRLMPARTRVFIDALVAKLGSP
ncbi:MAG TPA: LysR family transcriptional regulator [Burkholderiaceae bacterium]|nr:LysR family transcriptional regulator [Burkholderiaceae bacterium]